MDQIRRRKPANPSDSRALALKMQAQTDWPVYFINAETRPKPVRGSGGRTGHGSRHRAAARSVPNPVARVPDQFVVNHEVCPHGCGSLSFNRHNRTASRCTACSPQNGLSHTSKQPSELPCEPTKDSRQSVDSLDFSNPHFAESRVPFFHQEGRELLNSIYSITYTRSTRPVPGPFSSSSL